MTTLLKIVTKIDILQRRMLTDYNNALLYLTEIDLLTQDLSILLETLKADISYSKRELTLKQTT